jgi:Flp pilus assembly protein TadG
MRCRLSYVPRGTFRPRRGQALVEFALVMPIFLALVFGLAELSLISAAGALLHDAALNAARMEAQMANIRGTIDTQTVNQILHQAHTLFMVQVQEIIIYASDANGAGPQATAENLFDNLGNPMATQTWPVANRVGTVTNPLYVGVRILYSYQWLTSFISAAGSSLALRADAVMPLAPMGG